MSNKLIVRVGCGKGQRMVACHSFILWFVQLHFTLKLTLSTHPRTQISCQGKWGEEKGNGISIGMICGWAGSGQDHLQGIWGSSAQTGRGFEIAAYEAWAYTSLLTWSVKSLSRLSSWFFQFVILDGYYQCDQLFLVYLAESSRSLSIEGKWDDRPLDRRLSLKYKIFFDYCSVVLYYCMFYRIVKE